MAATIVDVPSPFLISYGEISGGDVTRQLIYAQMIYAQIYEL